MNAHPRYLIADWPAPSHVQAFTTLRTGGHSGAPYHSFNLAQHVSDDPKAVAANRQQLRHDWGFKQPIRWLNQVHGTSVSHFDQPEDPTAADACITTRANTPCAILTADCLPILLCNPAGTEIAAIHAGWRGLLEGVIKATVTQCQSPPESLLAWLGPAIGPSHFGLNDTIKDQFLNRDRRYSKAFFQKQGQFHANIAELARIQLTQSGISQIHGGHYCTVTDASRFFSYRRHHQTGRMASIICIKERN